MLYFVECSGSVAVVCEEVVGHTVGLGFPVKVGLVERDHRVDKPLASTHLEFAARENCFNQGSFDRDFLSSGTADDHFDIDPDDAGVCRGGVGGVHKLRPFGVGGGKRRPPRVVQELVLAAEGGL